MSAFLIRLLIGLVLLAFFFGYVYVVIKMMNEEEE